MNILQIYPGKVWGGAEQYILDLSHALQQRGHRVYSMCSGNGPVNDRCGATPFNFGWKWSLSAARRLARYIDDNSIDLIHIHDRRFVPVAIMARDRATRDCRVVFTRHIARAQRLGLLERTMFRRLDAVIFVSRIAQDKLVAANPWMGDMRTYAILNSIPPRADGSVTPVSRDTYGIDTTTPVIMFAGRVRKSKGITTLLDALARCNDLPFHLLIVGKFRSERYRRTVMKKIETLGLKDKVTIVGFSNNVRGLIDLSDIGVTPSIVVESCSLSNMEFMEAARPVVTTNNGGQIEYITDGVNGMLINPGDVDGLASALRQLLTDPSLRNRLGEAAQSTYRESLQYDTFVDRIIDAYQLR